MLFGALFDASKLRRFLCCSSALAKRAGRSYTKCELGSHSGEVELARESVVPHSGVLPSGELARNVPLLAADQHFTVNPIRAPHERTEDTTDKHSPEFRPS